MIHVLWRDGAQPSLGGHQSQSNHHDPHHFGKLYIFYVKTNFYF